MENHDCRVGKHITNDNIFQYLLVRIIILFNDEFDEDIACLPTFFQKYVTQCVHNISL